VLQFAAHEKITHYPLPGSPGVRTRSQRSGTRFPYTSIKMEFDQEKLNVYCGEIVYVYVNVNENDYAITPAKPLQAGTDRNVRATVCGA
jgi:hypothetical protein